LHALFEVHAGAELGYSFAIIVCRLDSKTALLFIVKSMPALSLGVSLPSSSAGWTPEQHCRVDRSA
jgi:hypothetical protein